MSVKRAHDEVDATGDTQKTKASSVGDNSLVVPSYDAANEPMPDSPVFREDSLEIERLVRQLHHELYGPINLSKSVNNVINGLKEEFRTRTKSQYPEEVCIALNGAMQAGKSATANSILTQNIVKRATIDTFMALLLKNDDFRTRENTELFLARFDIEGEDEIGDELCNLTEDLMAELFDENDHVLRMCPDETEESEEEIALRKELSLRLKTVEQQLNNEVKPIEILGIPEPQDSLFV
ncbi:hypothetical protein CKM354_000047200 [Cercospora kikuchii]|uniref:Uncharacterized protein n=1 Tax=Cercospora kikuchii TaxID=84275 RepID=A0A9P3C5W0_9PEZI|nr:uncharacterized protein CKM354_000047200 [Cercospora kikuchii]GIZ37009.1 hypothetical protein CKM354_000047200 [Cercospora kikuchii]